MDELHIFILPFLSPGHMIPLVDLAKLFAARPGVKATVVSTAGNVPFIENAIANSPRPIELLTLPFPSSIPQNASDLPNPSDFTKCPEFFEAIVALKGPFGRLVDQHRPDCIVSDMVLPWTADVAFEHGIPRLLSHGMGAFASVILDIIHASPGPGFDDDGVLIVPRIPHRIELTKSQMIPSSEDGGSSQGGGEAADLFAHIMRSDSLTHGTILNTFAELEPGYAEIIQQRTWLLGPLALCNRQAKGISKELGGNSHACLNWLDGKNPSSVIYVCFGSVTKFTGPQLREIAKGLRDCDHSFIWVVGNTVQGEEYLPEGFEERINDEGKGLIVRGWAPQTAILSHPAVGGFMTHCGWNSCLEGATAGVSMVTWPQFADQFINERLIVDVLRIGVAVGAKVWSTSADERSLVKGEEVAKATNEVMGCGEEAEGRRKRAKEIAVKAKEAMEEGGSSYMDMSRLIQELTDMKKARVAIGQNGNKNGFI